jgi:hypothetical protein
MCWSKSLEPLDSQRNIEWLQRVFARFQPNELNSEAMR